MMKEKKMRFIMAVILTLCVSVTGCSKSAKDTGGDAVAGGETLEGKYKSTIDVSTTFVVRQSLTDAIKKNFPDESYEKNRWLDLYRDELNINVKYKYVTDQSQSQTKTNLMMTSGDIPDFLEVSPSQARQLYNAGLTISVDELYEKYMPEAIKKIYEDTGKAGWNGLTVDGKMIAIPSPASALITGHMIFLRNDWLKNVGLSQPKTPDELLQVIKAFRDKDPDKNGAKDTYGITIKGSSLWSGPYSLLGFFNSMGSYPNIWVKGTDGKLVSGLHQQETRAALLALQNLYRDGYIDKEFSVKKEQQLDEDILAERSGLFTGEHYNAGKGADILKKNPNVDWASIPVTGKASLLGLSNSIGSFVISKNAKYPEAFFKMLNLNYKINLSEPELSNKYMSNTAAQFSPIRTEYYVHPEKNLFSQKGIEEALTTGDAEAAFEKIKSYTAKSAFMDIYNKCYQFEQTRSVDLYSTNLLIGRAGAQRILDGYRNEGKLVYDQFDGLISDEFTNKIATLDKMTEEIMIKIIMNEADISAYDEFLNKWNSLGGEQLTEVANTWYQDNQK